MKKILFFFILVLYHATSFSQINFYLKVNGCAVASRSAASSPAYVDFSSMGVYENGVINYKQESVNGVTGGMAKSGELYYIGPMMTIVEDEWNPGNYYPERVYPNNGLVGIYSGMRESSSASLATTRYENFDVNGDKNADVEHAASDVDYLSGTGVALIKEFGEQWWEREYYIMTYKINSDGTVTEEPISKKLIINNVDLREVRFADVATDGNFTYILLSDFTTGENITAIYKVPVNGNEAVKMLEFVDTRNEYSYVDLSGIAYSNNKFYVLNNAQGYIEFFEIDANTTDTIFDLKNPIANSFVDEPLCGGGAITCIPAALMNTLPVDFGSMSALLQGDMLQINWQTITEKNNDHFEIQISEDGKFWKKLADVKSLADNGNSQQKIDYTYTHNYNQAITLFGGAVLAFGLAALFFNRKNKWLFGLLFIIGLGFTGTSCNKVFDTSLPTENRNFLVRILQVDKDGNKSYSNIEPVVKK